MPTYYHYTTVEHWKDIEKDGFIKLTESNASLKEEHYAPDVVWLFAEPLKTVPKMMYATVQNTQTKKIANFQQSKAQLEIHVILERQHVSRADKFLKKHGASEEDMKSLEVSGGFKFKEQYVCVQQIPVAHIARLIIRKDLAEMRKRISDSDMLRYYGQVRETGEGITQ